MDSIIIEFLDARVAARRLDDVLEFVSNVREFIHKQPEHHKTRRLLEIGKRIIEYAKVETDFLRMVIDVSCQEAFEIEQRQANMGQWLSGWPTAPFRNELP